MLHKYCSAGPACCCRTSCINTNIALDVARPAKVSRASRNSGNQFGAALDGSGGEVYRSRFEDDGFGGGEFEGDGFGLGLGGGFPFGALVVGVGAGVELGFGRQRAVRLFDIGRGFGRRRCVRRGAALEIGGGDLKSVEQDAGAFEVHLVGGNADENIRDSALQGGVIDRTLEREGVVREDLNPVDAMVIAGVLVLHGVGAAADAGGVEPDALMRFRRLLLELWMEAWHGTPPGYISGCY